MATTNSVDGVWQQLLPGYTPPHTTLFHGQIQTGCGPADTSVGPFYCPVDQTAYFDTDFFQVLVDQFGSSGGPLAQEYVVAHEYGHHVQNLQGAIGRAQQGVQGAQGDGVRTELQADCYAGVWAHYAAITKQQSTDVTLPGAVERQGHCRRSVRGLVRRRRPHPEGGDRPDQPGAWTHGSSEAAAEVVHRRLPDRRHKEVRHLRDQQPWLGHPRPSTPSPNAISTRSLRWTHARQRKWASSATMMTSPTTPPTAWRHASTPPARRCGSSTEPAAADDVDRCDHCGDARTTRSADRAA